MGYRSDIVFVTQALNNDAFTAALLRHTAFIQKMSSRYGEKYDKYFNVDHKEKTIGFRAENWKWYSRYEDVQAFEEYFNTYQNNEENFDAQFIRTGEEFRDIKTITSGDGWDLAYVGTNIYCDYI
jgi:hypothetical protein